MSVEKKPADKKTISLEDRVKVFLKPCKTREELKKWIKYYLNLDMPDHTVSRHADTNPLDAIWEIYDICVNKNNPKNIEELLYVAGRGSGKCVKKGTKILTKAGPKSIEDVKIGDIVFTGWDWSPVKDFFDEGIKDGIEISTKVEKASGESHRLTGSLKHRVQAVNSDGILDWVYMKDLKPGDLIYRSHKDCFSVDIENKINQQEFPSYIVECVFAYINNKYRPYNGRITINGHRVKAEIPYCKELLGKDKIIQGYKIEAISAWLKELKDSKAEYLDFILDGYFETVDKVNHVKDYFYDLEIDSTHSYWSNGFISHNTLGVAVAEFMVMLHDQRDVVHVGAIMSQAKRCYEYQVNFMLNDKVRPLIEARIKRKLPDGGTDDLPPILEKANMEKSIFNITDRYTKENTKVSLEILPCTLKSVNGPHVALVSVDEIDTVSGEGLKAFKDIKGMLDSKRGRKALRVGISTRKSRYGLMNKQIEEATKAGRTVRRWTALEFSDRCADERSGTTPTVGYFQQDTMEVLTKEGYEKLDKSKKGEFQEHMFPGEKCLVCPIAAVCLGDAKNQKSKSTMLKPIDDTIKKSMEDGADWTLSQLFNLKPSIEGIVYKEFDEKLHVKSWNQMWHILTGNEFPGTCTHDDFVKKCHAMKLSCYAGIDWGWSNPSTVVYFFVDNRENVYVVRCEGRTYLNNPSWVQTIKNKWHNMYRVQMYFPDLANPGDAMTMRQEGLPCPSEQKKDTPGGVQIIKKWLKSLASPMPKIFFAQETCGPIIQEFFMYHFKTDAAGNITDEYEDEHDHWLDALRYGMYELFGKSSLVVSTYGLDSDPKALVDKFGNFTRAPSAEEFAASKGVVVNPNTDIDNSKLGKVGKQSELDDEDDGSGGMSGGNGGFLWSF